MLKAALGSLGVGAGRTLCLYNLPDQGLYPERLARLWRTGSVKAGGLNSTRAL
jgi:hypothetical protein